MNYYYVAGLFCSSSSGRIIGAKDHASVQINVADVSYRLLIKKIHDSGY